MIVNIYPQGDFEAAKTEVNRTQMPGAGAEPSFTPPAIQRAKLSNGMDLLLVEKHNLPLIQTNIVMKSGWAADPADKPGSAALTADMLDEGTKTKDALQISETAKSIGAEPRYVQLLRRFVRQSERAEEELRQGPRVDDGTSS